MLLFRMWHQNSRVIVYKKKGRRGCLCVCELTRGFCYNETKCQVRFPFICGVTPHDVHVMVCVRSFTFRRWFAVMCGMSTVDPTYRRSPPTLFTEWPTPCWWEGLISTFTTDNPSLRRLIYGCSASSSRMYYGLLESPQEIRIRRRIHTLVQSPPRVLGTVARYTIFKDRPSREPTIGNVWTQH